MGKKHSTAGDYSIWPLAILMFLVLILRFPTLFEPYWYADEGIYLAIGQALRSGWHLYTDIFDHKTPLIYLFAALSPNIIIWRAWGMIFALASTGFFYFIVQKLTAPRRWPTLVATLIFIALFNLPLLEGNIVNGEIFFMTFGLAGIFFWLKTNVWPLSSPQNALDQTNVHDRSSLNSKTSSLKSTHQNISSRTQFFWAMAAGVAFALGFLTKFHALADLAAIALPTLLLSTALLKKNRPAFFGLSVGFLLTLLLVFLIFMFNGDLALFWDRAFNFNLHYSEYTQITSSSSLTQTLLSTSGKCWTLIISALIFWILRRRLSLPIIFSSWWLLTVTVVASLSNRAYPHYFLQLTPAFALVVIFMLITFFQLFSQFFNHQKSSPKSNPLLATLLSLLILALSGYYSYFIVNTLDPELIHPQEEENEIRQTIPYYLNFGEYIIGRQNNYAFYHFFDPHLKDNYALADIIASQTTGDRLMIWGNNPQLYAQTHTLPVTPFLVNYHLYDHYFDTEQEANLELAWVKNSPTFVVWMKNYEAWNVRSQADEAWLRTELEKNYTRLYDGNSLELWQQN